MKYDFLKFDENGLIPAVIQDSLSGEVLMQAYMNAESLELTLSTGRTWFFSRSRSELWPKGETSGNIQLVQSVSCDCDGDCLLVTVLQKGAACHTGSRSCFHKALLGEKKPADNDFGAVISKLYGIISDRKENPQEGSYTNYLFTKGIDKILKKVAEESGEVIIAAKNNSKEEMVYEISDLLYHLSVLMSDRGISYGDIAGQLAERFK